MEARKEYIDILRGLATIGVIMIHVASNNWYGYIGTGNWYAFTIYTGIARAAVPIFFMISGALFLADEKKISVKYMLHHAVMLIPFLFFWGIAYQLINKNYNLFEILKNLLYANTQPHLWFIYSIIGIYIVTPFIRIFTENASQKVVFYALVVLFIFGSILPLCSNLSCFSMISIWMQRVQPGILSCYVGYFILGHYIDKWGTENKSRLKIIYLLGILGIIITIGAVTVDCILTQAPQERFWTYCMPWIAASSIGIFSYVKNNSRNGHMRNFMVGVSRYSLGIYGIHFMFILLLWNLGFSTFSFGGVFSVPVITLIVLLLSYGAVIIISKIPFGKYIV